jgi:hypothetical protein
VAKKTASRFTTAHPQFQLTLNFGEIKIAVILRRPKDAEGSQPIPTTNLAVKQHSDASKLRHPNPIR